VIGLAGHTQKGELTMFKVFKITSAGRKPSSPDLMGLLIAQTSDGIFLIDPEQGPQEVPRVLADALMGTSGPPFAQFKMHFKFLHWTIDVNQPTLPDELSGTWQNKQTLKHDAPDDEDNWTAKGTGTGTGTGDDDEARAASATY
jgi:hypothetical protein